MNISNIDEEGEKAVEKMWDVLNEENRKILVRHIIQGHHHMVCREIQAKNKTWCECVK